MIVSTAEASIPVQIRYLDTSAIKHQPPKYQKRFGTRVNKLPFKNGDRYFDGHLDHLQVVVCRRPKGIVSCVCGDFVTMTHPIRL